MKFQRGTETLNIFDKIMKNNSITERQESARKYSVNNKSQPTEQPVDSEITPNKCEEE